MRDLIERLRKLRSGATNETNIDVNKVSVNQLITLIGQNVDNRKLAIELDNGKVYMLNDYTKGKLTKGLIDQNVTMDGKSGSDEELVKLTTITKDANLISVEAKDNKTKPGGGFFK